MRRVAKVPTWAGSAAASEEELFWQAIGGCARIEEVRIYLKEFPDGQYADEAEACIAASEQVELVGRLLGECRAHHEAHRLTPGGIGGNALECYHRVLRADPGNEAALEGIAGIEQHYLGRAQTELDAERLAGARNAIDRLAMINPEHPMVIELQSRLEELEAARERVEALAEHVRELLADGSLQEARQAIDQARAELPPMQRLDALAEQVAAAEAAEDVRRLEELLAEGRDRLAAGDIAGARERLNSARTLGGVGKGGADELATEIRDAEAARTAERERLQEEVERSVAEGQFAAAREALAAAMALGLPEDEAESLGQRIDSAEAQSRSRWIAERLAVCVGHEGGERYADAMACYREVLEADPNQAQASAGLRRAGMRTAWSLAVARDSVDAYFRFETEYPDSPLAQLARARIDRMEEAFWRTVEEADSTEAYGRYIEIFPTGRHIGVARQRGDR